MVSILPCASSCQLLIFNLKEPFGSEVIKNVADKSSVQQMLYAIGALQAVENLENVSRIESKQQQQSSGENPRPILVKFMTEKDQAEALTNSIKLKNFPEWNNVAFEAYRTLPLDPEKEAMRKRLEELEVLRL
uniref:Uncharacterized protein n=1 Tax=Panagrolaimus sp. PS1159 TaxID=55785 RepID=A0AC35G8T7_9BILA